MGTLCSHQIIRAHARLYSFSWVCLLASEEQKGTTFIWTFLLGANPIPLALLLGAQPAAVALFLGGHILR